MTKDEIFKQILEWEDQNAESFVDYFDSNLNPLTFMTWCLGRGYLTPEKYNLWGENFLSDSIYKTSEDSNIYLYNPDKDDDCLFSVVLSDEWNLEDQHKAYSILAEFISEISVYQEKFTDFLNE